MSRVTRKSVSYICENIDADQLRGIREADQRHCFRFLGSTIPLKTTQQYPPVALHGHWGTSRQPCESCDRCIGAVRCYQRPTIIILSYYSCPNDHLKSCIVLTIRSRLLCSSRTGMVQCYLQHVYGLRAYDYVANKFIQYRMATGCLCTESVWGFGHRTDR